VLTGFLGSGKTTLVNRILTENHGKRIAVIENEFGEVGVDHELVIGADEEIFETSNGCICCTVRGDLIRILTQLRKRRDRFDSILIETTGLADPGPVAQTFFVDEDLKEYFSLDAIVTLVDAYHIEQALRESPVALEQIAFADVVLLNKTDLVDAAELERLERKVRAISATATVIHSRNAQVPLERVLSLGAFDLSRALSLDSEFMEPQRPFEWAGLYTLQKGRYELHCGGHDHDHDHDHDHGHAHEARLQQVDALLLRASGTDANSLEELLLPAAKLFESEPETVMPAGALQANRRGRLMLMQGSHFQLQIDESGDWALFTEHAPVEFDMHLHGAAAVQSRSFGSHHHDLEIASIGLTDDRALDPNKVNDWLSYLLQSRGQDLLRMKGVLNLRNEAKRFVFHGVHMTFDGRFERPWSSSGPRVSRLVFIGRNLDRRELEAGFESCVA
jgi:G3E family GTPase